MNILHLNLKAKWYDLIEQGIKKEEYREIKPYWEKRLCALYCLNCETGKQEVMFPRKETITLKFVYGYTKRNMTFKCEGISIGEGKQEWGAEPGQDYFVIKIGERIN